jgi:hypothetical protein
MMIGGMITNWRYNAGEPVYMPTIDSWTERLRPSWQCQVWGTERSRDVQTWINDNLSGDCETIMRFNSGNPFLSVTIHEQADATAFQLRWL